MLEEDKNYQVWSSLSCDSQEYHLSLWTLTIKKRFQSKIPIDVVKTSVLNMGKIQKLGLGK